MRGVGAGVPASPSLTQVLKERGPGRGVGLSRSLTPLKGTDCTWVPRSGTEGGDGGGGTLGPLPGKPQEPSKKSNFKDLEKTKTPTALQDMEGMARCHGNQRLT